MLRNYLNESLVGLLLIILLGLFLRSPHKIGAFLTETQVEEFKKEGIVIVENLLDEEELVTVTEELMKRVNDRPDDVRAEDLLNLHFNDSYIFGQIKQAWADVCKLRTV